MDFMILFSRIPSVGFSRQAPSRETEKNWLPASFYKLFACPSEMKNFNIFAHTVLQGLVWVAVPQIPFALKVCVHIQTHIIGATKCTAGGGGIFGIDIFSSSLF